MLTDIILSIEHVWAQNFNGELDVQVVETVRFISLHKAVSVASVTERTTYSAISVYRMLKVIGQS